MKLQQDTQLLIPFHFKIDTHRQQGGREQGAGGKNLETKHLYQVFCEMVLQDNGLLQDTRLLKEVGCLKE